MTHAEMIERAVRWLRRKSCGAVFSEMHMVTREEPDAIGWKNNGSIVVECKTSRADFFADRKKPHHGPALGMGRERYYLVPAHLVGEHEVPDWYGLLWAGPKTIAVRKGAPWRETWDVRAENALLASALRRHALGSRVSEHGRWEPTLERERREREAAERSERTSQHDVIW